MSQLAFIALKALATKEIKRFIRIWPQTLLPPMITTSLYFIVFGKMVGSRIGEIENFSYMQYIVPGLVMMSVIMNSYVNTVSSFFSAKFQRNLEEMLVSPMPNSTIILGYTIGGVTRGILTGLLVTGIALLFTHLEIKHPLVMFLSALLASALFSLMGIINGIYAKKFDSTSIIPTFVITPLTYLGGVFYSISLLPDFWYHVSLFNPILYLVSAFRFGMLGISQINIYTALILTSICALIAYCYCLYLFKKGIGLKT